MSDKNLAVREMLISNCKNAPDSNYGYILIDNSFQILFSNDFCNQIFESLEQNKNKFKNSLNLFKELNASAIKLTNKKIIDCQLQLRINNMMITKVHSIVNDDKMSVSFIFFAVIDNEIQSLLFNFIPVCDESNEVIFIQIFFNLYDYWGSADIYNLYDRKEEPIRIMNKLNRPEIKLTTHQEGIVFVISLGIGLRRAAQLLKISYGTLGSTIRKTLCRKFNTPFSDINLLIEKLVSLGYNRLIPQSLCVPKIIILDFQIQNKYFAKIYGQIQVIKDRRLMR